jgi:hypothetical protein
LWTRLLGIGKGKIWGFCLWVNEHSDSTADGKYFGCLSDYRHSKDSTPWSSSVYCNVQDERASFKSSRLEYVGLAYDFKWSKCVFFCQDKMCVQNHIKYLLESFNSPLCVIKSTTIAIYVIVNTCFHVIPITSTLWASEQKFQQVPKHFSDFYAPNPIWHNILPSLLQNPVGNIISPLSFVICLCRSLQ